MSRDTRSRFEAGAVVWAGYNRKPLGRIRHEVTWHNLLRHLPDIVDGENPPRLLDAGAGSGELALKLAQCGYRVWLLDYAPAMIDLACQAAQSLPDEVRQRLNFCLLSIDDAPAAFAPGFFDVITCHTLVEYLPQPQDTLRTLVGLLRSGGLLSLSFVNRHAEVLRQVWSYADPAGALDQLEQGAFCASLFGISGRSYSVGEVNTWFATLGLTLTARCGVRCFADYLPRDQLDDPEFLEALIRLELAVADRPPYCQIARYSHLLARKDVEPA